MKNNFTISQRNAIVENHLWCIKARFSAVAHLCRRGQIELPARKRRYGAVFFKFLRHKFRRFVSEQLHLQLLDRIPLGVTSQQQLHRLASRM